MLLSCWGRSADRGAKCTARWWWRLVRRGLCTWYSLVLVLLLPLMARAAEHVQPGITPAERAQVIYAEGIVAYNQRDARKARDRFRTALALAEDPQSIVARGARYYLALLRQQRLVQIQAAVKYQYDDNVVLEPNDEAFAIGRKEDGRTVYDITGRLIPVYSRRWYLAAEYALFQSLHFSLTEFDIQSHTGRLITRLTQNRFALQLVADYTLTLLNMARFSEAVTVQPSVTIQHTERLVTVVSVRYRTNNFFFDLLPDRKPEVRDRDGWTLQAGLSQYVSIPKLLATVRLGYYYEPSRNDGSDWEYDSHEVVVGLHLPLWEDMTLKADGSYIHRAYLHVNSFDAAPLGQLTPADRDKRRDHRLVGAVVLEQKIGPTLTVTAGVLHISNLSNLTFFEYHRNIVTLELRGRF